MSEQFQPLMGVIGLFLVFIRVIAGRLDNSFGIVCALILVNPQKRVTVRCFILSAMKCRPWPNQMSLFRY
jgi:hypothetical protein